MRPRTLRTLGGWAQGLLWANVGAWLVVALMTFAMVGALASYHDGTGSLGDVRDMEAILGATALLLAAPAYVTAIVLFLIWQHHAHRQLAAVRGAELLRYGPGLGVGCWFIPLANLVMPVLELRDLWVGSTHPEASQADRRSPMVWWWWALFVGVPATWLVITFIQGFVAGATGSIAVQPVWVSALGVLTYVSLAVAAALGARIVANLTRRIGRVTGAAGWQE